MNRGYTLRWRKRWDKGYHTDHLLWVMMDYFIDFANHTDRTIYFRDYGEVTIKRGEHLFGLRRLAEFFNVDMGKIRHRLTILENEGFLTRRATKRFTIIYVINYDIYQDLKLSTTHKATNKQQTNNKQTTTPNTLKDIKRINKQTYSVEFEKFWETYPNKKAKTVAYKSWLKIEPSNGTFKQILDAVENQKKCEQWCRDGGKFIPHPATWLNQCRWEDEVVIKEFSGSYSSEADKKFEQFKKDYCQ